MSEIAIAPAVAAEIVDALPDRVRKKADKLIAEKPWQQQSLEFRFENATVHITSERIVEAASITCTCLLAPRCAHIAAVALTLPTLDDAPTAEPETAPEPVAEITTEMNELGSVTRRHLDEVMVHGFAHLSASDRGMLLADLHRLRSAGMVRAERQLTTVLNGEGQTRANTLGQLLLTLHLLGRGDAEAIGTARRRYRDVGTLKLTPLFAEPVITDSGFAGAAVTFSGKGKLWSLSRVMPGETMISQYVRTASWGQVSAPLLELSRHNVLVSGATASSDGRLGSGKSVRVVVGKQADLWTDVPEGFECVEGEASQIKPRTVTIAERTFELTQAALRFGAGRGLDLLAHSEAQVQALVRRNKLLGLRGLDDTIHMPAELGGVWWPGLDEVERRWVGHVTDVVEDQFDPDEWDVPVVSVHQILQRWLLRCAEVGMNGMRATHLSRDEQWLRTAGAAFAAELFHKLADARDPASFSAAYLSLSAY